METAKPAPVEKKYDGVEITAKALENCWISVKVDGQPAFEGTIEKGKEMSWQGKENVDILAGNAGGIQITFNGKDVGTLGQMGQVEERSFKKDEPAKATENSPAQQESAPSTYEESSSQANHYSAPEPQPQPVQEEVPPAAQPTAPEPVAAPEPAPAAPQPAAETAPAAPQG